MKLLLIVLALGLAASPAMAKNCGPNDVPGDHPECHVEAAKAPASLSGNMKADFSRLPGSKGECAATGDRNGPDGCTILKQDKNHYEWPTTE